MLIPQAIVQQNPGDNELAYAEISALVTITSATESSPTDVISAGALSFDGATRICIEFYTAKLERGNNAAAATYINLWDASTDLGRIGQTAVASGGHPTLVRRYLTPSNGSHTYRVRGWRDNADGFVNAQSPYLPTYIRITTVDSV